MGEQGDATAATIVITMTMLFSFTLLLAGLLLWRGRIETHPALRWLHSWLISPLSSSLSPSAPSSKLLCSKSGSSSCADGEHCNGGTSKSRSDSAASSSRLDILRDRVPRAAPAQRPSREAVVAAGSGAAEAARMPLTTSSAECSHVSGKGGALDRAARGPVREPLTLHQTKEVLAKRMQAVKDGLARERTLNESKPMTAVEMRKAAAKKAAQAEASAAREATAKLATPTGTAGSPAAVSARGEPASPTPSALCPRLGARLDAYRQELGNGSSSRQAARRTLQLDSGAATSVARQGHDDASPCPRDTSAAASSSSPQRQPPRPPDARAAAKTAAIAELGKSNTRSRSRSSAAGGGDGGTRGTKPKQPQTVREGEELELGFLEAQAYDVGLDI